MSPSGQGESPPRDPTDFTCSFPDGCSSGRACAEYGSCRDGEVDDNAEAVPDQSCKACRHWRRCKALIQDLTGDESECDFSPSRFVRAAGEALHG